MRRDREKCGRRFAADTKAKAAREYAAGELSGTLARRYGCCEKTILKWALAHGVPLHIAGPQVRELPSSGELWAEYRELGSWQAVANKHGVALTTVLNRKDARVLARGKDVTDKTTVEGMRPCAARG